MLTELATRDKVVGVKQSAQSHPGRACQQVFLACDADRLLTDPMAAAPAAAIPVEEGYTMAQLGRACGIAVGAAVVAVLWILNSVFSE